MYLLFHWAISFPYGLNNPHSTILWLPCAEKFKLRACSREKHSKVPLFALPGIHGRHHRYINVPVSRLQLNYLSNLEEEQTNLDALSSNHLPFPGSGKHPSLISTLLPFFRAGIIFLNISTLLSSGQLCSIQRKRYTSAPLIGCGVKKSCAMNLIRGLWCSEDTASFMTMSCTTKFSLGKD